MCFIMLWWIYNFERCHLDYGKRFHEIESNICKKTYGCKIEDQFKLMSVTNRTRVSLFHDAYRLYENKKIGTNESS